MASVNASQFVSLRPHSSPLFSLVRWVGVNEDGGYQAVQLSQDPAALGVAGEELKTMEGLGSSQLFCLHTARGGGDERRERTGE